VIESANPRGWTISFIRARRLSRTLKQRSKNWRQNQAWTLNGTQTLVDRLTQSLLRVQQTLSTFRPHAQRNAFHRRDARPQSRSFDRKNQSLRHLPPPICFAEIIGDVLPSTAAWNLGHAVGIAILARCSEQTLDGEPTQHLGLDAVPKTGLGLGVVAHVVVTLARYPC
jgi:hypothetical protein